MIVVGTFVILGILLILIDMFIIRRLRDIDSDVINSILAIGIILIIVGALVSIGVFVTTDDSITTQKALKLYYNNGDTEVQSGFGLYLDNKRGINSVDEYNAVLIDLMYSYKYVWKRQWRMVGLDPDLQLIDKAKILSGDGLIYEQR